MNRILKSIAALLFYGVILFVFGYGIYAIYLNCNGRMSDEELNDLAVNISLLALIISISTYSD